MFSSKISIKYKIWLLCSLKEPTNWGVSKKGFCKKVHSEYEKKKTSNACNTHLQSRDVTQTAGQGAQRRSILPSAVGHNTAHLWK